MATSWLNSHKQKLLQQIHQKTLPHAILVTGVAGAGKTTLVNWLSQSLLCQPYDVNSREIPCQQCKGCHLVKQTSHPDLLHVELTGNHVGVEQVRSLSRFLEKTAQFGKHQVAIVFDADKLTESAGNALLKTLEEPTENSYIFLVASDEQRLLPTLISRCRVVSIRPPIGKELLNELGNQSNDPFVNLSHLPEISDTQVMAQFSQLRETLYRFLQTGDGRMALFDILKSSEFCGRWLEKIVSDLMREQAGWSCKVEVPVSSMEELTYTKVKPQTLWHVYNLIKCFNKNTMQLSQFNAEFGLEKLLVDMQLLIMNEDTEYGTAIS
ncbi:DNA polymerase III subunit [Thalassotalea sediminis]|uniref:DNA polymerase III subunit n=1 Tax=Thalassotalea sediminis TaxID=1759089 RepID=UPI0025723A30|nr:DNA polymerase III subunit delta' [Thalassotalea sediminis]